MKQCIIRAAVVCLAVIPFVISAHANAAPQTLGLVATNGPVELNCEAGHCEAEFSSFCLQKERGAPTKGTPYFAMDPRGIQIVASTSDGRQLTLSPAEDLTMTASRGHVAVLLSIRSDIAEKEQITSAQITIGDHITLKPVEVAGDPNPQSESDLKLSAGVLRHAGAKLVDGNTDRMSAARVTSLMINQLPPRGPYSHEERSLVWERSIAKSGPLTPAAEKQARNGFTLCDFTLESGSNSSFRRCLQHQHDTLLKFLNSKYWKAIGAGS